MLKSVFHIKLVILFFILISLFSCVIDEDYISIKSQTTHKKNLEIKLYSNLYAPQIGGRGNKEGGQFVKFNLLKNQIVTDDSWDIAFRGTVILINGGQASSSTEPKRTGIGAASIISNSFEQVDVLPDISMFKQDAFGEYAIPIGSGMGWYMYNRKHHVIKPIAGKVLIIKTHDGKYVKMEIISYYKDCHFGYNFMSSESRYYTFRYVYQSKGNRF